MAFTATQLEELAQWCATTTELAAVRKDARGTFFGDGDAAPVGYWPGADTVASRERRFLGWFMLSFRLADGRLPAECAAARLYQGETLTQACAAVRQARYVTAIVTAVLPGRGALLELDDERFDVRGRTWGHEVRTGGTVMAHLVPVREGVWLPGPGWLEWPIAIGPNMRRDLKRLFQPTPVEVERLLQHRTTVPEEDAPVAQPEDATLAGAVARMTSAAQAEGRNGLVLSPEAWESLVLRHLDDLSATAFFEGVIERAGPVEDVEELNRWLALARNIWNATPQPDRGEKTAYQLSREGVRRDGEEAIELDGWRGSVDQVGRRETI